MNVSRTGLISALKQPQKTLVYPFGCTPNMGFCADYSGLTKKLMACLQFGVGFRLNKIKRPRGFIVESGWNDYFEPFCGEVEAPLIESLNRGTFPYAKKIPITKPLVKLWLKALSKPKAEYFAFDELGPLDYLRPPVFFSGENYMSARRDLINMLWVYNAKTVEEVEKVKQELDIRGEYAAVCIRRGDKNIEHPYVDIEKYVDILRAEEIKSKKIFVATDDYSVVRGIAEIMPEYEFLTLTEPSADGYVHTKFKALPAVERRRRTVRFFAQLEVLRDAYIFIGSKTTNVSFFTNAFRGGESVAWAD